MKFSHALRLQGSPTIALVGAGGKTTALFQLARELAPTIITTSTHLGKWQVDPKSPHYIWKDGTPLLDFESGKDAGIIQFTGELDGERYRGLTIEQLYVLRKLAGSLDLTLIIEADGARQKPLKAPAEHEPAIPGFVENVIVVAGLSGFGKPLNSQSVHRHEEFSRLADLNINEGVSEDALATVLTHPSGGLKGIPEGAHRIALLNQADTPDLQAIGKQLALKVLPDYDSVVIASLDPKPTSDRAQKNIHAVYERTAGIILAAGESTRFGQPKQLLNFSGRTFIRTIAEKALSSGLEPVIAVTGANHKDIEAEISDLPLRIVFNSRWSEGQSTSIKAGISNLPSNCGSAIFLLADQPQVTTTLIRSLMERHAQNLPSVLAPLINDRRANPVLFDRCTFSDLLELDGDQGGRTIFSKFSPVYLEWADEKMLSDVDTPEDYQRLLDYENGE